MGKLKLLFADDSKIMRTAIKSWIDKGKHKDLFDITAVGDGNEAIDSFQEIKPDIVLLDINMPGLNGYKVLKEIRELEEGTGSSSVVIMLTSFENRCYMAEAADLGADGYIKKSSNMTDIDEKIYNYYKEKNP